MIELQRFVYKNCGLLKDTQFTILPGITVVRGRNRDRHEKSQNGVGKTQAIGLFTSLLLQEQLWAGSIRGTNKSTMRKGFKFVADLVKGGDTFSVAMFEKGNTAKYSVDKNGKPETIHGIANQIEYIKHLSPQSKFQIYSTFYLANGLYNPLLSGTSTQRSEFFESFFDLQFYDAIYGELNKRKFAVDEAARTKDRVESQLLACEKEAPKKVPTKDALAALEASAAKLLKRLSSSSKKLQKLSGFIAIEEQIETEWSFKKLKGMQQDYEQKIESLKKEYHDAVKQEQGYYHAQSSAKRAKKLTDRLAELEGFEKPHPKHDKRIRLAKRYFSQKETLASIRQNENDIYWYKKRKHLVFDPVLLDSSTARRDVCKESLRTLRGINGKKKCPCCQQSIREGHLQKLEKTLEKDLEAANATIEKQRIANEVKQLGKDIGHLCDIDYDQLRADTKKLRTLLDTLDEHEAKHIKYLSIEDELRSLKLVEKTLPPVSSEDLERKINAYNAKMAIVKSDLKLHEQLKKMDIGDGVESAKLQARGLKKEIDECSPKLDKIQASLAQAYADHSAGRYIEKQLAKLQKEMDDLDKKVKNRQIVNSLAAAYSPKGMRVDHIGFLAQSYIDNLNVYIKYMLDLSPVFSCSIEPNAFHIFADRSGETTDIRSFSKSETSQFLPVSALALCDLMADSIRFDTIVLDELEVGMSEPELKSYISNFVPLLGKMIPKVVVITAQNKQLIDIVGSHSVFMDRKNNETKIVCES